MVITETRRVDTTWIIGSEVTDRSVLSNELAQFCAKYQIYHVIKAPDSLAATSIETEGETILRVDEDFELERGMEGADKFSGERRYPFRSKFFENKGERKMSSSY